MLKVKIEGTIAELCELWDWKTVCELIRVDYYKRSLVPEDEQFTVTQEDLQRADLIQGQMKE